MKHFGAVPIGAKPLEKRGHVTYHLAPEVIWDTQKNGSLYTPELFASEGFIHCTDSLEELVAVGNRYYQSDRRPFVVLRIDCERVAAPIVYEDAGSIFPHVYGPLDVQSVLAVLPVRRSPAGAFVDI